jgi:hypothetical protein
MRSVSDGSPLDHSVRSASDGCTALARAAGTQLATNAVANNSAGTVANVTERGALQRRLRTRPVALPTISPAKLLPAESGWLAVLAEPWRRSRP